MHGSLLQQVSLKLEAFFSVCLTEKQNTKLPRLHKKKKKPRLIRTKIMQVQFFGIIYSSLQNENNACLERVPKY